jgi:hypothetical protein
MAARNNSLIAGKTIGEYSEGSPEFESWLYASQNPYQNWQATEKPTRWGMEGMQQQGDLVFFFEKGSFGYWEETPTLISRYLNGTGPGYTIDWYNDVTDRTCYPHERIKSAAVIGSHLFVSFGSQVAVSTQPTMKVDGQCSLTYLNLNQYVNRLRVDGSLLLACTNDGVHTSSDLGQTWVAAGLQGLSVSDLIRGNGYWLAKTSAGLHRLMDNDPAGWQSLGVFSYGPKIVWMDHVLYTIASGDVSYSLDKGDSWQVLPRDAGVPPANPQALAVEGNDYLFIGTEGRGIWRHPAVSNNAARMAKPTVASLEVYPNPTHGALQVRTQAEGRLSIWSLDGRLIQQGSLSAGEHSLDLATQPTGLYLLRWETNEGAEIRKIQKQ